MASELDDVNRRLAAAAVVFINAASGIAEALLAARAAQLRAAAERSREHARRVRAQVAATRRADAVVWRPATRAAWWRKATAQDVARAWQAAHTWHQVDQNAADALRIMRQRLAERGVHVDERSADPGDVRWLATALELAAAEQTIGDRTTVLEAGFEHTTADRDRMAEVVRREWNPEMADAVVASDAWPAMAYRLHELEVLGGDVAAVLATVDLAGARNPAALAEWQIENTINSMLIAETEAASLLVVSPEVLAGLDQEAARAAVLDYGAARLHIVQGQLGNATLDDTVRGRLDAHAGRLRDLIAEIPGSADVVATVVQREPVLLAVLKDGPLGELGAQREALADSVAATTTATAGIPEPATAVRLDTAMRDGAQTQVAGPAAPMSTKDLLAVAFPTSAAEAVAKAATQYQRGTTAGTAKSRARAASASPDRGR